MSKRRPPNFGDRESRLHKARERIGIEMPRCLISGESNPIRLELHHPAQHEFDSATIPLNGSLHADASDWQKDHPQKIEGCTSVLEPIAHWLFGLGDLLRIASEEPQAAALKDFLVYIANKLREFGSVLIELARSTVATRQGGAA